MTTDFAQLFGLDSRPVLTDDAHPGSKVFFADITPEVAAILLSDNADAQRKLSPASVDRYAGDMAGGMWAFNGATLVINDKGKLCDGQHRLSAIKDSGETQTLLTVMGVDADTMLAIDTGRQRTFADMLKIKKITNHYVAAAATNRLWYWDHEAYGTRNQPKESDTTYTSALPSQAQLWQTWQKAEKEGLSIPLAAIEGSRLLRACPGVSGGTYALAHLILTRIDPYLRDAFFFELADQPRSADSTYPINMFTKTLARRPKGVKLTHVQQLHYIFMTWNAWVLDQPLGMLRLPPFPFRPGSLAQPMAAPENSTVRDQPVFQATLKTEVADAGGK